MIAQMKEVASDHDIDHMVAELRAAGIPAHGDVFEGGPVAAVRDVLAMEDIDELIVSTHPEEKSGWVRKKNVLAELRRLAGDRPFTHVVSDVTGRTGRANVLVVANETVLGERLLDRIRERAAQGPAGFLIVSPQSVRTVSPPAGACTTSSSTSVRIMRMPFSTMALCKPWRMSRSNRDRISLPR